MSRCPKDQYVKGIVFQPLDGEKTVATLVCSQCGYNGAKKGTKYACQWSEKRDDTWVKP